MECLLCREASVEKTPAGLRCFNCGIIPLGAVREIPTTKEEE